MKAFIYLTIVSLFGGFNGFGQSVPVGAFDSPADRCFGLEKAAKHPFRLDWSAYKFTIPLAFVAGFSDGVNQTINYHYSQFKAVFPGARDQYWNPAISWENKYAKNSDGTVNVDYEAFPFSTNIAVFVTDGHHVTRFGDHSAMLFCVAVNIHDIG